MNMSHLTFSFFSHTITHSYWTTTNKKSVKAYASTAKYRRDKEPVYDSLCFFKHDDSLTGNHSLDFL